MKYFAGKTFTHFFLQWYENVSQNIRIRQDLAPKGESNENRKYRNIAVRG